MDRQQMIEILNSLYETTKDGVDGYQKAAEATENAEYKQFFLRLADQRAQFGADLQHTVMQLAGTPQQDGSTIAQVHRTWMDMKATIVGKSEQAMLAECLRGDQQARNHYDKVLNETENLPAHMRSLLTAQRDEIERTCNTLQAMTEQVPQS